MIRWKGLFVIIGIVIVVLVLGLVFSDSWLERKLENAASGINGAKVEIDDLNFSLFTLDFGWKRLQVTDPGQTMLNAFETGPGRFNMEFLPLLSRRVIIENLELTQIRTGTQRATDGKLPPRKKAEPREPGFLSEAIDKIDADVKAKAQIEIGDIKQKTNIDSVLQILDIRSVGKIDSLQSAMAASYQLWEEKMTGFDPEGDLRDIEAKLKALDVNKIKTADDLQKALTAATQLKTDVERVQKDVKSVGSDLTNDFRQIRGGLGSVDDWVKRDYKHALTLAHLPEIDAQNIGQMIFGEKIFSRLTTALKYIKELRYYAAKMKSDKPEKEKPARLRGQNIAFPAKATRPQFWIKNVAITGQTNAAVDYGGTVKNVVSDQRQIQQATEIKVQGSNAAGVSLDLAGVLDYRGEKPAERFDLNYTGFDLAGTTLSNSNFLPNKLNRGTGKIGAKLVLEGKQIDGEIDFTANALAFDFSKTTQPRNRFEMIGQKIAWANTDIEMTGLIHGDEDGFRLSLRSSLDDQIARAVKAIAGQEVENARRKIEEKIDRAVAAKRAELDTFVKQQEQKLRDELAQYEAEIAEQMKVVDARKKEIQDQIDAQKKKVEKQVKDKVKSLIP